ncbi:MULTISPECIES: TIGR03936 family radical SAM-associated protein [unclassified Clostridium]|uniref:TIGR03936 family radical SAM-associated protein n=1 Tax=unclassified Clostridium TaxID=2614128 RepID=UPI0025BEAB3D|nr:TIGR03936 family radical SAM-associated protein [Clostridium sp.]MCI6693626.1 TIGR03936 family radical SAM-associated protein [Clostridium sp.]MDY2631872.1 TIGR03936 family radical SAM-associated protein [Clostridium sp.]MDY6226398.1 TIGR03936 family radical SAM-associated protein [Clostridium sp.]
MRYVIKFTKESSIKFISHLDLMRTIQRVIRRADLPMEYSKGFNPHMAMSIAQPLSVGVYSDAEYMDIVLVEELSEEEVINRLNAKTASGIKFLNAKKVVNVEGQKKVPQSMALVDAARFTIKMICKDANIVEEKMKALEKESQWTTIKKSKKGEKEVNLKTMIKEMKYWINNDELIINIVVSSGSREHLSPDLVANYIKNNIPEIEEDAFVDIKREEMYVLDKNKYIPIYKFI